MGLETAQAEEAVACRYCDLRQTIPRLSRGSIARCARCNAVLVKKHVPTLDLATALALAAAIVFIVANTLPLMRLSAFGLHTSTTILGGALAMWQEGRWITAAIVAL